MVQQAEENEEVEIEAEALEQVEEVEQEDGEQPEAEQTDESEASESEEVVVSIGDEPPPSEESTEGLPEWVKTLRHEHREKARELRKLKAELAQRNDAPAQAVQVGPKPTLADADIDYDTEKFEARLTAWHDRKRQADEQERQTREATEANQKAWNAKLETYGAQKAALKVSDYEDAEAQVLDLFNVTQQGVILQGAENAAVVVYALGKSPAKAKELSSITDPVKFAFAVAKLETQMKVTPRKSAPLPESKVSGSGRVPVSGDAKLAALEAKADKTGDRTELVAYKRAQRLKQAA